MNCPKCGKEVRDDTMFCTQCGASMQNFPVITLNKSEKMSNDAGVRYSSSSQKTAIILSAFVLLFAVIQRVFFFICSQSLESFLVLPEIVMLIMCCLLHKINPAITGIPKAITLLTDAIIAIFAHLPFSPLEFLISWLPSIMLIVFYFLSFSNKKASGKVFRVLSTILLVLMTGSSVFGNIRIWIDTKAYWESGWLRLLFIPSSVASASLLILLMFTDKGTASKQVKTSIVSNPNQISASNMFCPNCGMRFPVGKKFCDQCGRELKEAFGQINSGCQNVIDASSGGFGVLGFFFPIVGLILYLVWKENLPLRAKSAGKGALIGAITATAFTLISYVIYFVILSSLF